jgi:hypothetical protein
MFAVGPLVILVLHWPVSCLASLKKLAVDESALLKLLHRWREEAQKAGRRIERIAVAFKAGRDGFWSGAGSSARHRGLRFTLRVQRCPASIGAPRLTGSTPSCSKRSFLGWLQRLAIAWAAARRISSEIPPSSQTMISLIIAIPGLDDKRRD